MDSLPAELPEKPHPLPPFLLLPSVFSSIKIFSRESALSIRQPKYECWISLQSIGLSSLQQHNSKASILRHSAFFMAKLSHLYMTFGKTIALTIWTFVGKVMSLPFNMLSGFLIIFKKQASFNFMAAVTIYSDFGAPPNKICHCFYFFPFYLPWSDGTRCHDLSFFNVVFSSQLFHSSHSPSSRGSLVPLHFCH